MRKTAAASGPRVARDYVVAILAAALVALGIRFFLIEAYRIPSSAMRPALLAGDTVFVAKWPFGFRTPWSHAPFGASRLPQYGEVVIFAAPDESGRDYVKRVLGLPGDTVQIHEGRLFLNSRPASAKPVPGKCGQENLPGISYSVCWESFASGASEDFPARKIPEGQVFVLGDSRPQPANEANPFKGWGLIPLKSLKGKALWIWMSVEPRRMDQKASWFSRIRIERIFRRVR